MSEHSFDSVVIAGGVVKAVAAIGCIRAMEMRGALGASLRTCVGTSAGSIVCLMLCLGMTSPQMEAFLLEAASDPGLTVVDPAQALELFSTYGLSDGQPITRLVHRLLARHGLPPEATFMDVAKRTGKDFVACVSNLSRARTEYLSVDASPHLPVATAVRISCSLPFVFSPVVLDGDVYVDGGVFNNLPLGYLAGGAATETLAVNIVSEPAAQPRSFAEFACLVVTSAMEFHHHAALHQARAPSSGAVTLVTLAFEERDWGGLTDIQAAMAAALADYVERGHLAADSALRAKSTSCAGS